MRVWFPMVLVVAFQMAIGVAFSTEALTLEECLRLALANNQNLKIARVKIKEAEGKKIEAFGNFLPSLVASGDYTRLEESPRMTVNVLGMEQTFILGPQNLYSTQITIRQPLFTWGKIYQADRQARLYYLLANEEYKRVKNNLTFEVKRAFFSVLLAEKLVAISEEAVSVAKSHYETTKALYREGKASDYDVSRAKVQLVNNETNLIKAKNSLKLAREELALLMNTDLEKNWEIKGELSFEKREVLFDDALKRAFATRTEMQELLIQEKMADASIKLARAENRPNLYFLANYEYTNPFYNKEEWGSLWTVAVSLNFPLFNGFSDLGRVRQARAVLEQVKIKKSELEGRIKLEVRKAIYDMEEAKERIEAQRENVRVARENLRIARERHSKGLMAEIEVRDAQLSLTQAETDYFQALYDYNVASFYLDRTLGLYQ